MKIISIDNNNLNLLESFLSNDLPSTFRYFSSRNYNDIIKNHFYTLVGKIEDKIMAYAHIDFDLKDNKYWLGICILNGYQNRGFGRLIMAHLINNIKNTPISKLHLTVDLDNKIAFNLYKKFGFNIINQTDKYYEMVYYNSILDLPVSFGEAFDKLTILDIKIKYIKDDRVIEVQKEYDMIYNKIKYFFNNNLKFYYNVLKIINENIWILQDIIRDPLNENNTNFDIKKMCLDILDENDRRFRIKSKINNILSSSLKEQKGYKKKKIFILPHLGLGDSFTNIGMVRYFSTIYDEVCIVCKKMYEENMNIIYKDDPSIKLYIVNSEYDISPTHHFDNNKLMEITKDYNLLKLGVHDNRRDYSNIPFCFYEDAKLPLNIFWDFFHIPDTIESANLFNLVKNIPYIIIHDSCSYGQKFNTEFIEKESGLSKDEILFINLNKNVYQEGHKFYELANNFVFKLLPYYKDSIINASKIYVCNSSVFCMCINLDIKTDDCFIVSETDFSYLYKNTGFNQNIRKQFKNIFI